MTHYFNAFILSAMLGLTSNCAPTQHNQWGCFLYINGGFTACTSVAFCERQANRAASVNGHPTGPCRIQEVAWCYLRNPELLNHPGTSRPPAVELDAAYSCADSEAMCYEEMRISERTGRCEPRRRP